MTAHDMLSWLGERLEQRLENQAQWHALVDRLEAWRAEAVAAEREACAKLAEGEVRSWVVEAPDPQCRIAAKIRARGQS